MTKKRGIAYSVCIVSILGLMSKLVGFLREGVYSYYLGTSAEADDYFLVYGFFFTISTMVGISIGTAYLPQFLETKSKNGITQALKECSTLINQVFVITSLLILVCLVFSEPICSMLAPTYSTERLQVLSYYFRSISVILFFSIAVSILGAVFDAEKRYGISRIIKMLYSVCSILFLVLLFDWCKMDSLIWAVIISFILQFIISIFGLFRHSYYSLHFKNTNLFKVYKQTIPVLIGTGTLFLGQIVDRTIASTLQTGTVSALNYSGILHSTINTLFIASIIAVFYTEFSEKFISNQIDKLLSILSRGISMLILILIPISIFCISNSENIIRILLQRGAFTEESVKLTTLAFSFYLLGSPFYGIRDLISRVYYAFQDVKTPMINGCVTIVINILICLSFVYILNLGVMGITLAASITAVISTSLLLYSLHKKGYRLHYQDIIKGAIQVAVAAVIALILMDYMKRYLLNFHLIIQTMISFFILFSTYGMILLLMKNKDVYYIKSVISNKIKHNNN